jgi:hypothetical protein
VKFKREAEITQNQLSMNKRKLLDLSNEDLSTQTVVLTGSLNLTNIEKEITLSFSKSLQAKNIIFDLTDLHWIEYLPAKLLFAWIAHLKLKGQTNVSIKLPSRESLPPQINKILLADGVFSQLVDMGVNVNYFSAPTQTLGVPLTVIKSEAQLWNQLQATSKNLINTYTLLQSSSSLLTDLFDIVAFELLENAFKHASGQTPCYGINFSKSFGSKSINNWESVFVKDTNYVEIYVGDLGPGIQATLENAIPENYKQPFNTNRRFLKEEITIAYSFEFSSTSDKSKRQDRILKLLTDINMKEGDIA